MGRELGAASSVVRQALPALPFAFCAGMAVTFSGILYLPVALEQIQQFTCGLGQWEGHWRWQVWATCASKALQKLMGSTAAELKQSYWRALHLQATREAEASSALERYRAGLWGEENFWSDLESDRGGDSDPEPDTRRY